MFTIYKLTNEINGKFYIGFTCKAVAKRIQEHVYHSRRKTPIQHFHRAIRKYGISKFFLKILEIGENEEYGLKVVEPMYIACLSPEYNKTDGGEGTIGMKFSPEHRKKLSEARKGRSPWNKGMIGLPGPNKGKTFSTEHRNRLSLAHLGKTPWNKGLDKST